MGNRTSSSRAAQRDDSISLDDEAWSEDNTFVYLAFRPDPEEFEVGGKILIATTTKDGYYKVEHKIENDVNQPPIPAATHSNTGLQVGAGQQTASQVGLANDILAEWSGHHMEQKSNTGIEETIVHDSTHQVHAPETVSMRSKKKSENDIQRGKGEAAARAIQSLWNTLTMVSFSEFGPHLFQTHFINYDDYERAQKKSIHDVNKEVMINVLLKAKGAIQLNPELFQTFCDGLRLCTGGVACYEKVTAEYQEILREKGLEADQAVKSVAESSDTDFGPSHIMREEEPPVHPKRRVCSQPPDGVIPPFSHAQADRQSNVTRQEQPSKSTGLNELHKAASSNQVHKLQKLLSDDPSQIDGLSENGNSSLHIAARKGNTKVVKELLSHGADTNLQNKRKQRTPVHLAVAYEKAETAKLLIHHADEQCLSTTDKNGDTAMHTAFKRGSVSIAKELMDSKKCDAYCANSQQLTPLHYAAHRENEELVHGLVKRDERTEMLNAVDDHGRNALHVASERGSPNIVKMLVQKDKREILRRTKNREGKVPKDVAKDEEISRILGKKRKFGTILKKFRKKKRISSGSVTPNSSTPSLVSRPSSSSWSIDASSMSSMVTSGSSLSIAPSTTPLSFHGFSTPPLSIGASKTPTDMEASSSPFSDHNRSERDVLCTSSEGDL